jgi:signal transduction histidine kinase
MHYSDILTLSKLDSDLLPVAPIRSNILESVNAIISMFTHEFKSADIALHLLISEDFKKLGIDDVYVDPSRLGSLLSSERLRITC